MHSLGMNAGAFFAGPPVTAVRTPGCESGERASGAPGGAYGAPERASHPGRGRAPVIFVLWRRSRS